MQDIFYTQQDYSKQYTHLQKISISLRPDGFSFVIQAVDTEKLLAVFHKNIDATIQNLQYILALQDFFAHDLLQQTFQRVTIVYVSPKITIIPSALYSPDTLSLFFQTNHVLVPNEVVLHYKLKQTEGYLVFSIPQPILDVCYSTFGKQVYIIPQAAPFLESSSIQNKLLPQKQVYVSLENSFFDIAVLEGQKILLYNTFEYANNNDYIYFVMNVFEQLQLHPMEQKIVLSGIISKASHYYESTCMFISHVHIVEPSQSHKDFLQYPFEHAAYPLFSNLCNVGLCE